MSPEQLHQRKLGRVTVDGIRPKPLFDITGAKIAVIGLDSEGLSLSTLAASSGFETVGFDADEVKVAQLEMLDAQDRRTARNLSITSEASQLRNADVFIICAATPVAKNGKPDLTQLEEAAALVGRDLRQGALVIVGSVVFPGVCEHVVLPILEKQSELARPAPESARGEFFFAHAPLRVDANAPRVVGASNAESLSRALAFYRTCFPAGIIPMSTVKEAEAVSMVEDAIHDVTLAVTGELAMLFDRMGVDITDVLKAVAPHSPSPVSLSGIGNSRTLPAAYYLTRSGHEHGTEQQFLANAHRIIERMPEYAVKVLSDALREKKIPLKKAHIALLGVSGPESRSGNEEHAGSRIRDSLERKGAKVTVYDPYVASAGRDLKGTLEGAQAALIAGDHPMFRNLTSRQFEEFGIFVVVDARNCLDKKLFEKSPVLYRGIGRG